MSEEFLIQEGFTVEFMPNEQIFIINVINKKDNTGFTSSGRNYDQLWSNTSKDFEQYKLQKLLKDD
jgi:hypothetical protein